MGLHIISRWSPNIDSIGVDYSFDKVNDFKYLGVNINSKNIMHVEINEQIRMEILYTISVISLDLSWC